MKQLILERCRCKDELNTLPDLHQLCLFFDIYNQYILPLKKEIKRLLGEIEKYEQSIVEVSNKLTVSENYYPGN